MRDDECYLCHAPASVVCEVCASAYPSREEAVREVRAKQMIAALFREDARAHRPADA